MNEVAVLYAHVMGGSVPPQKACRAYVVLRIKELLGTQTYSVKYSHCCPLVAVHEYGRHTSQVSESGMYQKLGIVFFLIISSFSNLENKSKTLYIAKVLTKHFSRTIS